MFYEKLKTGFLAELMGPVLPTSNIFYMYLASALLLAIVTYFWFSYRESSERPDGIDKGLFGYIFDRDVWLHRSAFQDYVYFFVNGLIYYGIIAHFLISGHVMHEIISIGLDRVFGARQEALFAPSVLSATVYTLTVVMMIDFAIFLTHFTQHKVAALWHFHSVHHSAEVLTFATVSRQHPVDLFFTGTMIVVLTQLAFAGFSYLTLVDPQEIGIFNFNIFIFTFFLLGYNLRHSHIWLSYPPWISYIFISPAQHQTHHSVDEKHFDRNFGFIFAFWDWLFGTLYVPRGYEKLEFGLSRAEPNPFNSITDIYLKPFKLSWMEISKGVEIIKGRVSSRKSAQEIGDGNWKRDAVDE